MNWILKTLVGAVVAGVGWKIGSDAYETLKRKLTARMGAEQAPAEEQRQSNGAGATQTAVVDLPAMPPDGQG